MLSADPPSESDESGVGDDRLRLIFTCCHPALALEAQVALTLRTLAGPDDGRDRAGVPRARDHDGAAPRPGEAQDPQRRHPLPRAARAPARRSGRARSWRSCISCSTRATRASAGADLVRREPYDEAIRLTRTLAQLMPDEPEALGLLALLLLHDARRAAPCRRRRRPRTARGAGPDALGPGRDRRRRRAARRRAAARRGRVRTRCRRPSPRATRPRPTRRRPTGPRSPRCTASCVRMVPTPVVELNRAVAVAMADGPEAGLALVDALDASGALAGYHLLPATRADLLRRSRAPGRGRRRLSPGARSRRSGRRAPVLRAPAGGGGRPLNA